MRDDQELMQRAIGEAVKGLGHTSPNPAVGALLVTQGKILARGFHQSAGSPHAEVRCLQHIGQKVPPSATLYVTLEPCSTFGRTPPCVEAIVRAGIRRVVIGASDPNPLHSGRGIDQLRAAGVEVTRVLEQECNKLNEAYNKWITTGTPFVVAKCAMSLDGHLTRPPGESQWLTSPAARRHARRLRSTVDAILVGAETIRRDDPKLTTRLPGRKQPLRVVLTRSGRLPAGARIFNDRFAEKTIVIRSRSLSALLRDLGRREITSVLIEGGGNLLEQANDAGLVDKLHIYIAPLLTGGSVLAFGGQGAASTQMAARLNATQYEKIDNIVILIGYPKYPSTK